MELPALRVALLGEVSLSVGERALPAVESGRAESLLAYLRLHRGAPQPRMRIAGLLWPDSSEAQARTNLRHVLHTLRQRLTRSRDTWDPHNVFRMNANIAPSEVVAR